jgi:hypothetical protein
MVDSPVISTVPNYPGRNAIFRQGDLNSPGHGQGNVSAEMTGVRGPIGHGPNAFGGVEKQALKMVIAEIDHEGVRGWI